MGYDIFIYGEATLQPERFDEALTVLRAEAAEEDGKPNDDSFEDLVQRHSHEHFHADKDAATGVWTIANNYEDGHRHTDDAEKLFQLLAPFLDDASIRFEGEDGHEWSWDIQDGKLTHDSADKVWGGGAAKASAFDEIVSALYPNGKFRKPIKGTLDRIETIIRKAGFGPLAGLNDLEALAKASEN